MPSQSDKKTTIILLIVLAISIIGGGIWTYNSFKSTESSETPTNLEEQSNLTGLSINTVYQIKDDIIDNVFDFMGYDEENNTIWNDFYTDKQFNRLNDINLEIDIDNYQNNPYPFVVPTSTEEVEEEI